MQSPTEENCDTHRTYYSDLDRFETVSHLLSYLDATINYDGPHYFFFNMIEDSMPHFSKADWEWSAYNESDIDFQIFTDVTSSEKVSLSSFKSMKDLKEHVLKILEETHDYLYIFQPGE